MCGRYGFGNPARFAGVDLPLPDAEVAALAARAPRFNIAPSQDIPVILRVDGAGTVSDMRWGLVPSWAKDPSIGNRLANARAETAHEKPSFRRAFRSRRALAPADLYYEWQAVAGASRKQPWCIRRPDDAPFMLGAIWEAWTPPDGTPPWRTCAFLTTTPNATMAAIHDRMPVIVPRAAWDVWLDPASPLAAVQALCIAPPEDALRAWRVSFRVNAPSHDDAQCIEPL